MHKKISNLLGNQLRDSKRHFVGITLVTGGLFPSEPILCIAVEVRTSAMVSTRVCEWWIKHDDATLDGMSGWAKDNHGKKGWIEKSRNAEKTLAEVEKDVIQLIAYNGAKRWSNFNQSGAIMVAMSTRFVRNFLAAHMPTLDKHFHHRDVSIDTLATLMATVAPAYPKMNNSYDGEPIDIVQRILSELVFFTMPVVVGAASFISRHEGEPIGSHVTTEEWIGK